MKRYSNDNCGAPNHKKRKYNDPQIHYSQNQSDRGQIRSKITIEITTTVNVNDHDEHFQRDNPVQYLEQSMPIHTPVSGSILTKTTLSTTVAATPLGFQTFSFCNYLMNNVQVLNTFDFNAPPIFIPQLTDFEIEGIFCECLKATNSCFQQPKIIKKETPVLSYFPQSERWT